MWHPWGAAEMKATENPHLPRTYSLTSPQGEGNSNFRPVSPAASACGPESSLRLGMEGWF